MRSSGIALLLTLPALCPAQLAPVFLDHVYIVVASGSFDALQRSPEIRALAGVAEKTIGLGAGRSLALFVAGRQTTIEIVSANRDQASAGVGPGRSGIGLVTATEEGLDHVEKGLRGNFGDRVTVPFSAREVTVTGHAPDFLTVWFTELHPGFIALRSLGSAAEAPPVPVGLVASPFRPDQLLDDFTGLTVALDLAETTVLVAERRVAGWASRPAGANTLMSGPDATIKIVPAHADAGIREVRLRLRRPVPRQDTPLGSANLALEGEVGRLSFGPTD